MMLLRQKKTYKIFYWVTLHLVHFKTTVRIFFGYA